jgi:SAM-dependent methyltransferase
MAADWSEYGMQRRVAGIHDLRLDGMTDILQRVRGRQTLDLGCNRGLVSYDFYQNGAIACHGLDIDKQSIIVARSWFADIRQCDHRFECVDLTRPNPLAAVAGETYDVTMLIATYHKLKRVMNPTDLSNLIKLFGSVTKMWFCWRGTSNQHEENTKEMRAISNDLAGNFEVVQWSKISRELGPCAIWERIK